MTELSKTSLCNISINVFYNAKTRNSFCWRYFGHLVTTEGDKKRILNPDHVYCAACLSTAKKDSEDITFGSIKIKKYNKTVSTGNLTRHLRDDHQIQDDHQLRDDCAFVSKANSQQAKQDKCRLGIDLVLWYCKSLLPFESVADEGMMDFLKKYDIVYSSEEITAHHIVSNSTLKNVYESLMMQVKETISTDAAQHFAMAFDLWADQYRQLNYITFKLHYLTSDFVLKSWTLSTQIITGKLTGEKINDAIEETRKSFALDGKKIVAITDIGSNVKRAFATHHLCIAHGLHNLIIADGIDLVPEISSLVQKCTEIVKTVRYRVSDLKVQGELINGLDKTVEMLEMDIIDPIIQNDFSFDNNDQSENLSSIYKQIPNNKTATPTRWHTILEILENLTHKCNLTTINNLLRQIGQEELRITKSEWVLLEELVIFLRSFREIVDILTSQKTCTLNVALVFRSEVIDLLNAHQENESLTMLSLKRKMMENLNKRLPVTKPVIAAALLDNRFISLKEIDIFLESHKITRSSFLSTYIKEKEIIIDNEMPESLAGNSGSTFANSNKTDTLLHKLSKKHCISTTQGIQNDPIEQECWRYIAAADPLEPKDGDLLSFWNSKKEVFPYLTALARILLCVPATSSSTDKVFSPAGLTINTKKCRLSPITIDKMLFIHENHKLFFSNDDTK